MLVSKALIQLLQFTKLKQALKSLGACFLDKLCNRLLTDAIIVEITVSRS